MSDSPKPEFTEAYAQDVKARFEKNETELKALVEFLEARGYKSPVK